MMIGISMDHFASFKALNNLLKLNDSPVPVYPFYFDQKDEYNISSELRSIPSIIPAMKRSPIDWQPDTQYNTEGILGGMIIPSAPADTITAVANFLSYPSATIAGINIPPIAATVAGPE